MLEGTVQDRIIVALDCAPDNARLLAKSLAGNVRWLKVGMTLYYAAGPQIVDEFKQADFKVFVDLKLHDIPHQVAGAAASLVNAGADMLTVHASGGEAMMRAAVDAVANQAPTPATKPIVVAITVLTSTDESMLAQLGIRSTMKEQVSTLADIACAAGCDGVVCSPQEARALRKSLGSAAAIVTPGVRPAGASLDDQARVSTPCDAIRNGASHLVIGRPITAAADPLSAYQKIVSSIEEELS